MLRRLPRRVERIASAAEHGRLSVHVRLFADERDRRHVTGLLHQMLLVGGVRRGAGPGGLATRLIWLIRLVEGRMTEMWTYRESTA